LILLIFATSLQALAYGIEGFVSAEDIRLRIKGALCTHSGGHGKGD